MGMYREHTTGFRIFWGVMAFYMLNICIDAPTNLPFTFQDPTFNEQESLVEIIIEKVMGYENAIPENDSLESDEHIPIKNKTFLDNFILSFIKTHSHTAFAHRKNRPFHFRPSNLPAQYLEQESPPPEA
tara:strand:+ start:97357 stop:97743 length:387 start_codon:yes stop_codon:yes gene_type:complete